MLFSLRESHLLWADAICGQLRCHHAYHNILIDNIQSLLLIIIDSFFCQPLHPSPLQSISKRLVIFSISKYKVQIVSFIANDWIYELKIARAHQTYTKRLSDSKPTMVIINLMSGFFSALRLFRFSNGARYAAVAR